MGVVQELDEGACISINPTGKDGKAALILFRHPWPAEILSELHWSQLSCSESLTCKARKCRSIPANPVLLCSQCKATNKVHTSAKILKYPQSGRKCWDLSTKETELQNHIGWKRSLRSLSPSDTRIWVLIFMLLVQWKYKLQEKPMVDNLFNSFSG